MSLFHGAVDASASVHRVLLTSLFRWSMPTFDTTPNGRILNRFSFDMSVVDMELPENLDNFTVDFFSVLFFKLC